MSSDDAIKGGFRAALKPLNDLSRKKKVLVIILVALLIAAPIFLFVIPELRPLPLSAGSTLTYTLSGSVNNTTVNAPIYGEYNCSIGEFTKTSYAYSMAGEGHLNGAKVESPLPFFWKKTPGGMLVYYDRISTPMGLKTVGTYFEPSDDKLILVMMGVESSVLYRMVVSTPDYHYSFTLKAANQTNLAGYDNSPQIPELHSMCHPVDYPFVHEALFGNYTDCRSYTYGSLEISEGERVKYDLSGNYSTALFFAMDDLRVIEGSGLFYYNASLSRQMGDPGSTDILAYPGTYWFIIVMHATGSAAMYWGI